MSIEHCELAPKEFYLEDAHTRKHITPHEWLKAIDGVEYCLYCGKQNRAGE